MLYLELVGVKLATLEIQFDNCGSIHEPVPGLLVSQDIDVELGQEGLDTTLALDGHKSSLEVLR